MSDSHPLEPRRPAFLSGRRPGGRPRPQAFPRNAPPPPPLRVPPEARPPQGPVDPKPADELTRDIQWLRTERERVKTILTELVGFARSLEERLSDVERRNLELEERVLDLEDLQYEPGDLTNYEAEQEALRERAEREYAEALERERQAEIAREQERERQRQLELQREREQRLADLERQRKAEKQRRAREMSDAGALERAERAAAQLRANAKSRPRSQAKAVGRGKGRGRSRARDAEPLPPPAPEPTPPPPPAPRPRPAPRAAAPSLPVAEPLPTGPASARRAVAKLDPPRRHAPPPPPRAPVGAKPAPPTDIARGPAVEPEPARPAECAPAAAVEVVRAQAVAVATGPPPPKADGVRIPTEFIGPPDTPLSRVGRRLASWAANAIRGGVQRSTVERVAKRINHAVMARLDTRDDHEGALWAIELCDDALELERLADDAVLLRLARKLHDLAEKRLQVCGAVEFMIEGQSLLQWEVGRHYQIRESLASRDCAGTVARVHRPGYRLQDGTVLRPAEIDVYQSVEEPTRRGSSGLGS